VIEAAKNCRCCEAAWVRETKGQSNYSRTAISNKDLIAEPRRPEGPPSGAPYSSCERIGNPWVDFLMVIKASGIARGHVRTTTVTTTAPELPNMAAIVQRGHRALVYRVLLWYWTTVQWSIDACQKKVSAGHYHMTISRAQVYSSSKSHVFERFTADQVLIFQLDRGLMSD